MTVVTHSPEETVLLGRRLGERLEAGSVVALVGPLGAGKTVLTKGLAEGLGVPDRREVTSPTFVLIHEYQGRLPVYHIDAYRLDAAADAEALGTDELFFDDGACIVEWADRIAEALPPERLEIRLEHAGEQERRLDFQPRGERYERIVEKLEGEDG